MDTNLIVTKLNSLWPGVVLESRGFGRSGISSVWLEAHALAKVAPVLKSDFGMDWLEHLTVVELEEVFVLTYFLRSTSEQDRMILRLSAVPQKEQTTRFVSVREVWPMVQPMEKEAEDLFGIRFDSADGAAIEAAGLLPSGWQGFPLRKGYQFPKEFRGINHARIGSTVKRDTEENSSEEGLEH